MLDDLKYIHEKDKADALGILARQGDHLRHSFTLSNTVQFSDIHNIVYAGMGGSALAGQFLHTWPQLGLPLEVVRDYTLPAYVGSNTLCIISSYSGNTEETISALEDAAAKGGRIVVVASGGKLEEIATARHYPFVLLPKAAQPRYAAIYNFKALLTVLLSAGVIQDGDMQATLERAAAHLDSAVQAWLPTVSTANNPAKQLALELMGKSVVIYGGPNMYPAAYRWKIDCNENAKQVAWAGQLPEFNHNEFLGWSQQPVDKPYAVVDLRSSLEHPRVRKRFEVSARMLSGRRPDPHVVQAQGENVLEHLLWAMAYGDFVTVYLALLNGLDPAPVDLVEAFKKELDK